MAGTTDTGGRRRAPIAAINVTPLVDVMLVLLVIMMVSATYIVSQTLKVELPKTATSDGKTATVAAVTITDTHALYLNKQPVTEDGRRRRARRRRAGAGRPGGGRPRRGSPAAPVLGDMSRSTKVRRRPVHPRRGRERLPRRLRRPVRLRLRRDLPALRPDDARAGDAREAIRVAWFATGGSFAAARTGRSPAEPEAASDNVWTAPDSAGDYTVWFVVRDDRGGADWRELAVQVE